MKKYPIVEVAWVDSAGLGGWLRTDEYLGHALTADCLTAGYLLKSDRKRLVIVQSLDPGNNTMRESIAIPRSAVRSIKRLT